MDTSFAHPLHHLRAELARLDRLIQREILRLRAGYQLSQEELRGLYISNEQVDALANEAAFPSRDGDEPPLRRLRQEASVLLERNLACLPSVFPWAHLAAEFELSQPELDVLLMAVAPELDAKYDTLYAYLNNDVARTMPTPQLALRLFADDDATRLSLRAALAADATLFVSGLLRVRNAAEPAPWPRTPLVTDPGLAQWLLALGYPDAADITRHPWEEIGDWSGLPYAEPTRERLRRLAEYLQECPAPMPIIVLQAGPGTGKRAAGEALARALERPLVAFDLRAAATSGETLAGRAAAAVLRARLAGAVLYVAHMEALLDGEGRPTADVSAVVRAIASSGSSPVVIGATPELPLARVLSGGRMLAVPLGEPDGNERASLWRAELTRALGAGAQLFEPDAVGVVADRFKLSAAQIRAAADHVADTRALGDLDPNAPGHALFRAARAQSDLAVGRLALRIDARFDWGDLVLPAVTTEQLHGIASAIRNRRRVFGDWGFGRYADPGSGFRVLFAGPSGTGKTMAASVIARELETDLYRIDLAQLVSKYIGDTEKNFDRVFGAAEAGNVILFFDEADALFGKRSEISDAHDRYANIEVAYLLQKLEVHPGIVFLATNLARNIDDAFSRRLHVVVEFPLPDAASRERLWRNLFPADAPVADDVDFVFLAKQFNLAGGDIRNVALDAAFRAAENGQHITMREIVQALSRQLAKQGRTPSATDFRQFHQYVTPP